MIRFKWLIKCIKFENLFCLRYCLQWISEHHHQCQKLYLWFVGSLYCKLKF